MLIAFGGRPGSTYPPGTFAARIAALSEPGGYFDTDNLISNERSYLQVIPELQRANIAGGAYIGVGPDQNFSYIAAVRPRIAFIIDLRRDNLLLHLFFKALFGLSRTRVEYVALLFGRPVPADLSGWREAPIGRMVARAELPAMDTKDLDLSRARIDAAIKRLGVPLSGDDLATIGRFHRRFIEAGLEMRFQSTGRLPQPYYPTYRDLLLETDGKGGLANFLASEDAFQFVKSLQSRDLVIPVVGDLSGPSAMQAIGQLLRYRGERLSVFYASNVELYLFRDGSFARFVRNLESIPHTSGAVLIRSVFGRYALGGSGSTSRLQPIEDLLDGFNSGRIQRYAELVAAR
jgi:hypothetical protein